MVVTGEIKPMSDTEGVHQVSVLSLVLFNLVLDTLTEVIQSSAAWSIIYADDVAICTESRA